MSSFKTFAVAPSQNTGTQHDANGAFHPGAQAFSKAYNSPWRTYDNTVGAKKVKQNFYDAIDQFCPSSIDLFAYFGHGIPNGLPSPGVYESDLDDFVRVLSPKMSKPFVCVLYACSAGAANGFSTKLRERLGGDVWVYAHTSVGHAYMNPDVSEVMADNTPAYRLLYPYGSDMRAAWSEALHYTDLWLRFPLLYNRALDAEVNARRLLGTWEVSGAGAARIYEFDNPGTAWNQDSGVEYDAPPSGTVRALDPKKRGSVIDLGTWEITDRVTVTWRGGGSEFWPLPLKVVGQQFTAGVTTQTARRLNHTLGHGRLQG